MRLHPLPRRLWLCIAVYALASLAHFAHNAEYIAFYPNMPAWLTSGQVWLVWLAITGVGAAGVGLMLLGAGWVGRLAIAAYGAMGLDGLGHYALALCSEHTWVMNGTIVGEAVAGVGLAVQALRGGGRSRLRASVR